MTNEKMLEVLRKGNLKELEVALIENIRAEVEKGNQKKTICMRWFMVSIFI